MKEGWMLDRIIAIGLIVACLVLAVVLNRRNQPDAPNAGPIVLKASTARPSASADAILDVKLPPVRLQRVPAAQAILTLADLAHANLAVRWEALSFAGVRPQQRVTLRLESATFREALTILLNQFEHEPREHLAFAIIDGVVIVSTYGDFEPNPVNVAYNIRDLLERFRTAGETPSDVGYRIVQTLRHEVAPETWRDNGGKFGETREFSGILLVTQPVHEQAEVEEFLEKLRGPQGQRLVQPPDRPATNPATRP